MKLVLEPWRTSGCAKTAFSEAMVICVNSANHEPAPIAHPLMAPMIGLGNSHKRMKLRLSERQESITSAALCPVGIPYGQCKSRRLPLAVFYWYIPAEKARTAPVTTIER